MKPAPAARRGPAARYTPQEVSWAAPALAEQGLAGFGLRDRGFCCSAVVGVGAVNKRCRQLELGAEPSFAGRHAAVVGLMVIAGQVQQTMQNKDLQFLTGAMSVAAGVGERDLGGDGDVATFGTREREHVSRLVFAAEAAIELFEARVAGDQHVNFARNFGERTGPRDEAAKLGGGDARHGGFENDHALLKNKSGGPLTALPQRILLDFYCCSGGSCGSCCGCTSRGSSSDICWLSDIAS